MDVREFLFRLLFIRKMVNYDLMIFVWKVAEIVLSNYKNVQKEIKSKSGIIIAM